MRQTKIMVNRLIRLSYGPFQLGEAPDGAVEEVRTRVLMDQLGPTLIHEAKADFSSLRREEEDNWRQQRETAAAPPKRERPDKKGAKGDPFENLPRRRLAVDQEG